MMFGTTNDAGPASTELGSTNVVTLRVDASGAAFGRDPFAISAISTATGVNSSGDVYGVIAKGGSAPLLLEPGSGVGPPTGGTHVKGEFFVDSNAAMFQCVANGTPGNLGPRRLQPAQPDPHPRHPHQLAHRPEQFDQPPRRGFLRCVPTQASAIVVNATVTQGTAQSVLTIYPEGINRPTASNLNWVAGQTIPNLVTVKLGTGGGISIYNAAGTVDVVLDLAGFYS